MREILSPLPLWEGIKGRGERGISSLFPSSGFDSHEAVPKPEPWNEGDS
jgi:hypothetical protein